MMTFISLILFVLTRLKSLLKLLVINSYNIFHVMENANTKQSSVLFSAYYGGTSSKYILVMIR